MKPSEYLKNFTRMMEHDAKDGVTLYGDALIVEKIPVSEKTTSSGIIKTVKAHDMRQDATYLGNLPEFVRVLMVGAGYYDDEKGESVPCDVKPGDVILVGKQSTQWFSQFGDLKDPSDPDVEVGITRESEIKMKFKSEDSYLNFFKELNRDLS